MTHLSFLHLVLHLLSYIFQGTQAIEGLFLDRCKFNPSYLNRESFKEMNRLRLLKIRSPRRKLFLEDHLPRDFAFSSYELTYLYWDGYPSEYLPMNFHAKNLVELLLRNNNIKQLWRGNKVLLLLFSYTFFILIFIVYVNLSIEKKLFCSSFMRS